MGWCSGTEVFDRVMRLILPMDVSNEAKKEIILAITEVLEEQDWDCQDDSEYASHPLVLEVWKELHPNWEWE